MLTPASDVNQPVTKAQSNSQGILTLTQWTIKYKTVWDRIFCTRLVWHGCLYLLCFIRFVYAFRPFSLLFSCITRIERGGEWVRERDRQTDRQTETKRQRKTKRETETQTQTDRQTETDSVSKRWQTNVSYTRDMEHDGQRPRSSYCLLTRCVCRKRLSFFSLASARIANPPSQALAAGRVDSSRQKGWFLTTGPRRAEEEHQEHWERGQVLQNYA